MEILTVFGERLKQLRNERRIYQREMGDLLGVTHGHYQKIERGDINISISTLCTLADYFCVSTDYLLGRSDKRKKPKKFP